jgi:hypothetical protein
MPTRPQRIARTEGASHPTAALRATRTVNNLQANQPGAGTATFLRQVVLPTSASAQGPTGRNEFFEKLNFRPGDHPGPVGN